MKTYLILFLHAHGEGWSIIAACNPKEAEDTFYKRTKFIRTKVLTIKDTAPFVYRVDEPSLILEGGGYRGKDGEQGIQGEQGPQGLRGPKGDTGNGISSIQYNGDDTLTITFTNGETFTTPSIKGNKGDKGDKGEKGDPVDTSIIYTKSEVNELLNDKQDVISDIDTIRSNASAGANAATSISYDSTTKKIYLKSNNTILDEVDATDFIKDGMVENVTIENDNVVISFNTDSGKENISIPINKVFNASNYYTKDQVDNIIPTKVSELANDAGYLTEHQSLEHYVMDVDLKIIDIELRSKVDKSDVYTKEEIDNKGYLTEHQDISGKANIGDSYTKAESDAKYITEHQDISGLANTADLAKVATTGNYNDLSNKPTITDENAINIRPKTIYNTLETDLYQGKILFTTRKGTLLPINTTNSQATDKPLTTIPFDPYAPIYYYFSTTYVKAGVIPNASSLYLQMFYFDTLRSINLGATLTRNKLLYLRCIPLADGTVVLDGDNCAVQDLPTSVDGKVYLQLGMALNTSYIWLPAQHPIFQAIQDGDNVRITLWDNANDSKVSKSDFSESVVSEIEEHPKSRFSFSSAKEYAYHWQPTDIVDKYKVKKYSDYNEVDLRVSHLNSDEVIHLYLWDKRGHSRRSTPITVPKSDGTTKTYNKDIEYIYNIGWQKLPLNFGIMDDGTLKLVSVDTDEEGGWEDVMTIIEQPENYSDNVKMSKLKRLSRSKYGWIACNGIDFLRSHNYSGAHNFDEEYFAYSMDALLCPALSKYCITDKVKVKNNFGMYIINHIPVTPKFGHSTSCNLMFAIYNAAEGYIVDTLPIVMRFCKALDSNGNYYVNSSRSLSGEMLWAGFAKYQISVITQYNKRK